MKTLFMTLLLVVTVTMSKSEEFGVTSFTSFENKSGMDVYIVKREHQEDNLRLGANETRFGGMWIPWVDSKDDFESKTIDVQYANGTHIYIWQQNVGGDDRVRTSTDGWMPNAAYIKGVSQVNGDRRLIIYADHVESN